MQTLLRLARNYVLLHAVPVVAGAALGAVEGSADRHLPLPGGLALFPALIELLGWADAIALANVCTALRAAVGARLGSQTSPIRCRPQQLEQLAASKLTRLVRALEIDCSSSNHAAAASHAAGGAANGSGAKSAGAASAAAASSAPRSRAGSSSSSSAAAAHSEFDEESVRIIRSLPLLRSLALLSYAPSDPLRLLVLLTRRPGPALLQRIRLDGCPVLDAHVILALANLPVLNSLALTNAALHDETESDDVLVAQAQSRKSSGAAAHGATELIQRRSSSSAAAAPAASAMSEATHLLAVDSAGGSGSAGSSASSSRSSSFSSSAPLSGEGSTGPLSPLLSAHTAAHLTSLSLDGLSEGNAFRGPESLLSVARLTRLEKLHVNLPRISPGALAPLWPRMWASAAFRSTLRVLSLRFVVLIGSNSGIINGLWPWGSSPAAQAALEKAVRDLQPVSSLEALEQLELAFVSPLRAILPHLPSLPRLTSLMLGDEDFRALEDESENGLLLPLLRCRHLRRTVLFGYAGILRRRERMRALSLRALQSSVEHLPPRRQGMPDPNARKPLPPRVVEDGGETREQAMRRAPQFAFDYCETH